ncbi:hypothetical protein KIN20_027444 [Parelaphostrongylus tenuis]|uniref:Uncharacterized protein n=1 Tax=Parelaphostrongylus tenuis TaxID=148309 RepID=A0AAD5QZE4_PARTN|nr:hypothetical protein KIN20_027444 [Parelaphostrongylus tenuis]
MLHYTEAVKAEKMPKERSIDVILESRPLQYCNVERGGKEASNYMLGASSSEDDDDDFAIEDTEVSERDNYWPNNNNPHLIISAYFFVNM